MTQPEGEPVGKLPVDLGDTEVSEEELGPLDKMEFQDLWDQ